MRRSRLQWDTERRRRTRRMMDEARVVLIERTGGRCEGDFSPHCTPNDDFEWWAKLPDRDAWMWVPVDTMTEPGVFDHPHSRSREARAHPVPGRDHDGETPRVTLPTPRSNGWRADAACRGVDPVEFFPDHRGWHNYSYVAGLCAGCPVYDECLADALLDEGAWTTFGFRAGMTADERREFAKEIAA